jgi:hypothetical protein
MSCGHREDDPQKITGGIETDFRVFPWQGFCHFPIVLQIQLERRLKTS